MACQCSLPSGLNEPNDLEGIFSAGTGTAPLRPSARQWILEPSREREQAARKQKGELCTLEGMSRERSVVPERARTKWISSAVRHCREAESSSAVVKLEQRSVLSYGTVRWTTVTATADRLNHTPIAKFRIRMDYNTKFLIPVFGYQF